MAYKNNHCRNLDMLVYTEKKSSGTNDIKDKTVFKQTLFHPIYWLVVEATVLAQEKRFMEAAIKIL